VAHGVSSLTVTPTVADSTATVKVNNVTVTSGTASGSVNLNVGPNTITVVSTAQNGTTTKTYTITVTRAASANADLSNIALSSGTLTPTFASGTTTYTASVAHGVSSLTVTPTVADSTAVVKVNNVTVTSGTASGSVNLNVGPNTITVVATAQDGTTTKTYTVEIYREFTQVTLRDLTNIPVPAAGESPTKPLLLSNEQYNGSVTWTPDIDTVFQTNTTYTAIINLDSSNKGYTFNGLANDFFVVPHATNVTFTMIDPFRVEIQATFPKTDTTINISEIQGITPPVASQLPVYSITSNGQFDGFITWSPDPQGHFEPITKYTANITISPKSGYTLFGVNENFFTVPGAEIGTVTNDANSGAVTAVFPHTGSIEIQNGMITGIDVPETGETPIIDYYIETHEYTGNVNWLPELVDNKFAPGTTYNAVITLKANPGYIFANLSKDFFNVEGTTTTPKFTYEENIAVIIAEFPVTQNLVVTQTNISQVTIPTAGASTGTSNVESDQYVGSITWSPTVNGVFAPLTQYEATINLTTKTGYIFTGVATDFSVQGATSTTFNQIDDTHAVITARFPATGELLVTNSTILGVTAPVTGASPVTTIVANDQYTGTVSWSPSVSSTFASGTTYTAVITLEPKTGYTLSGVSTNFFTVSSATSVSNNAGSGVITAVFPATVALTTVNLFNVAGVTVPETGELNTSSIDTVQYVGTISWSPSVANTFAPGTIYTATITLTPKAGYTLSGVVSNYFKVAGGSATNSANSGTITVVFPRTVNMVSVPAGSITKAPISTDNNLYSINISNYLMSDTEVTYGHWYTVRQWAMSNGYTFTSEQGREGHNGTNGEAPTSALNEPVTDISWRDIIVWLNAYSQKEGLTPVYRNSSGVILKDATQGGPVDAAVQSANNGYRLPTKAEWAIAARWLGTTAPNQGSLASARITSTEGATTYYWLPDNYAVGSSESTANVDAIKLVAWFDSNSGNSTKTVATRLPNVLGLYDMSGNVDELLYDINTNPGNRIITGGSYDDDKDRLTPDDMFLSRSDESPEIGFRFVRTHINEPPTNIALSSTSVAENEPTNTVVGTLTATDPDPNSTFTYTLVSGTGDTDNASFNISGNQLRINAPFDYETKNSYSIRIRVRDNGTPGLTYEKTFTITVSDVNDGSPT
jgi:formylglycine-generating enzyme required for sulfatase activity